MNIALLFVLLVSCLSRLKGTVFFWMASEVRQETDEVATLGGRAIWQLSSHSHL